MKKKNLLLIASTLLTLGCMTSCASSSQDTLTILTFTDELKNMINDYYLKAYPEDSSKIKVEKSELNAMATTLTQKMENNGKNLPGMVALEAAVVLNYIEPNYAQYLEPLDDIVASGATDNMYSYTKDVVTGQDGHVYGLAWQATPGGFFYKRSVAAKAGINSIEEMENKISTWSGFLDLAKDCADNDIKVVSCITEPVKVFMSARKTPWVVNNELQIDDCLYKDEYSCMRVMHDLEQENYTSKTTERSTAWFNDIKNESVLGYFASSWSLYFDLEKYAGTTAGDWAMCKAPNDYYNGGTWLSAISTASDSQKALAKKIIKYFTTDESFLTAWGKETGDFMNNKNVMNTLKTNYSSEFLGGQNHLDKLFEVADGIDGSLISPYDNKITSKYKTWAGNYAMETPAAETIEDSIEMFENSVVQEYPTITIPE